MLHHLSSFINSNYQQIDHTVTYWYEGNCPETGQLLRLPRTIFAEKIALSLMKQLQNAQISTPKGKMYGILLIETETGELGVLKAFSGLFNGQSEVQGWVPPMPGRSLIALAENLTLTKLAVIKQEIIRLQQLPQREEYKQLLSEYEISWQKIKEYYQQRKEKRAEKRQPLNQQSPKYNYQQLLVNLNEESRQDNKIKRKIKHQLDKKIQPLQELIYQADQQIIKLKHERKQLSRQLQAQMQTAYTLTNFAGNTLNLSQLMSKPFIPTGTGDCCAPKLLHYAAINHLKPLAIAEFWWGISSPNGDKISGQFYGACAERCQPLMGFLLSGLPTYSTLDNNHNSIPIIYEDEYILVVNKPTGLLSVPGRGSHKFDSVETRLNKKYSECIELKAVHRLDQETSGLLILAKNRQIYINLKQQFEQRSIKKFYEAVLAGKIKEEKGAIALPLWGDPTHRPKQQVNWQKGKPSMTHFRRLGQEGICSRMEFIPITGRTHQIRIHAAAREGLGVAIKGDRLYGDTNNQNCRLHLHAREISFWHPHKNKDIHLEAKTPF